MVSSPAACSVTLVAATDTLAGMFSVEDEPLKVKPLGHRGGASSALLVYPSCFPSGLSATVLVTTWEVELLVAQSCLTLCDPMDYSPLGSSVHGILRQEYWSGLLLPSPGDLPNPRIELGSPALQADSLLSKPPGKA